MAECHEAGYAVDFEECGVVCIIGTHGFARADLTPSLGGIAAAGGERAGYTLDWAWAQRLNDQKWQAKVPDAVEEGGVWTNPVMGGGSCRFIVISRGRGGRGVTSRGGSKTCGFQAYLALPGVSCGFSFDFLRDMVREH